MFNPNPLGPNFNEGMIDRLLGKAYLTIKEVHDNLEEISKATSITEDNKAVKDSVDKLTEALGAFEKGSGLFIGHDLGEVGEEIDSNTYIGDNFLTSLTKSTSHLEIVGNDIEVINTLAAHINELKAIAEALDKILDIKVSTEEVDKILPYVEDIQHVSANREAIQAINNSIDDLKKVADNIDSFPEVINSVDDITKVSKYIASIVTCASNIAAYLEANQKLETAQAVIENGSLDKVANISESIQTVATNASVIKTVADNIDSVTSSGGLAARLTIVENTVNDYESRIAANESSKEDHESRISSNTTNISNLTSRVTAIEDTNASQTATLAEHETRLDNMETSSDAGQLATKLAAIEEKNTEQDTTIAANSSAIIKNTEDISANTLNIATNTASITNLSSSISANTTAISNLEKTLQNSINTEISSLSDKLSSEESTRKSADETLTSSLEEVQSSISSMDSRFDNFVTLATTETITGKKTFSQTLQVNNAINSTGSCTFGKVFTEGVELIHATPYIDFHYNSDSESDYTSRIIEKTKGNLTVIGTLSANTPATTASGTEVVTAKWVTDKLSSSSSSDSTTSVGEWFPMFGEASNVRCTGTRHEISTVTATYTWTAPAACWIVVEGKGGTTSGKDCSLYCTISYGVEAHFTGTGSNNGDNVYAYGTCFMPKGAVLKVTMNTLSWVYLAHTAIYKDSTTRPSSDTPSE